MLKRSISILLVICVLLGALSVVGTAAESGEISENLRWELDTFGTLRISGSGNAIPDYSPENPAPWAKYAGSVKELSLPGTLRGIGAYAFADSAHLKQVNISRITALGAAAFKGCGLNAVELPYQLKTIPADCFAECTQLQSVCFKEVYEGALGEGTSYGAEHIGERAFEYCTALSRLYTVLNDERKQQLPTTLQSIGADAFSSCDSLQGLTFANGGKAVKSLGAGAFRFCENLQSFTLPAGISTVEKECFYSTGLKSIVLPVTITAVRENAFAFCDGLTKIDVYNNNCSFFSGEETTPDSAVLRVTGAAKNAQQYAKAYGKPIKVLCTGRVESHAAFKNGAVQKASAKQAGSIAQVCSSCGYTRFVAIAQVKTVKLSKTAFYYTGKVQCPTAAQVLIYDAAGKRIAASNYTIQRQTGSKEVGKHSVKITFKAGSRYTGSFVRYYSIVLKGTSIRSVAAGRGALRVNWLKQAVGTSGYQLRFCKSKTFRSGVVTKTVWSAKAVSATQSKLARATGYYIQVRTFRKVGKNAYVFSAWSTPCGRKTK
ncbi:MAG: leucine-rich repeat domain-containing protein [Clostridia bacterium]|nr:leucine-rich repeat domain-containing protein [Clostridia bacterium]